MWSEPTVRPPAEHPRLFMRRQHKTELLARMQHGELQPLLQRMKAFSTLELDHPWCCGTLETAYCLEANALLCSLYGDAEAGRRAIELAMRAVLKSFNPNHQDISREIGRLMLAAAIVYDWCYDLLSPAEKEHIIAQLKRLASLLECGYPPLHEGAFVGHTSEWMLMRDMMAAGIAIYDEDPEMYNWAAGRFFAEFVPARNFFYPSGWHHQGDNYGSFRYQAELFATWIFARMGYEHIFDPTQEQVGYQWIYTRRPDGKLLRDGDTDNPLYEEDTYIRLFPLVYLMAGNYYRNGYFIAQQKREHPNIPDAYLLFALLFHHPELPGSSLGELPLTRYFGAPAGIMVARTGWDEGTEIRKQSDTAVVEMKIGMYQYNNHQHLDAGAFQIYYKGYLAIDSGIYKGSSGKYQSPHNKYYFKRTVAHNAMLVHDPHELEAHPYIVDGKLKWPNVNDGGQRWPGEGRPPHDLAELTGGEYQRGDVLAQRIGPDSHVPEYSYLKGDLTKAYSAKMRKYTRSFVFLNLRRAQVPAVLIVFDDVTAADKDYEKTWLLHSIEQPELQASRTLVSRTEDGYGGELAIDTLLPRQADIRLVGGAGQEFKTGDTHYPQDYPGTVEQGAWRMEVRPRVKSGRTLFLHAIQIKDCDGVSAPDTTLVEEDAFVGVLVQGWQILFSRSGAWNDGSLCIPEDRTGTRKKLLLADMAEGAWMCYGSHEARGEGTAHTAVNGVLQFEAGPGALRLERM